MVDDFVEGNFHGTAVGIDAHGMIGAVRPGNFILHRRFGFYLLDFHNARPVALNVRRLRRPHHSDRDDADAGGQQDGRAGDGGGFSFCPGHKFYSPGHLTGGNEGNREKMDCGQSVRGPRVSELSRPRFLFVDLDAD